LPQVIELPENKVNKNPEWLTRGKTIRQLIQELQSFENDQLEVKISTNDGASFKCISIVEKEHKQGKQFCALTNCE